MNLGPTIKKIRKEKGITQAQLSDRTELSQAFLSLVEANKKEPALGSLKLICASLEIPLSVLIFLASTEEVVQQNKLKHFYQLFPSQKEIIKRFFNN